MEVQVAYTVSNRIDSFYEYKVPREYQNGQKQGSQLGKSKSPKAQGNYMASIQKQGKIVPGPGRYQVNPQTERKSKKKSPRKIDFDKLQKSGTHTFLDEVVKHKSKLPGVGKYQIEIDKTQLIRKKYQAKGDRDRKKAQIFRPTVMDTMNRDNLNISPANYEVIKPLGYKSSRGSIHPEHKRSVSLPKLPSSFEYAPVPVSYQTFERKQSFGKIKKTKGYSTFGAKSSSKIPEVGPGPKYNLVSTWVIKRDKYGNKKGKNLFQSISNLKTPSVYH